MGFPFPIQDPAAGLTFIDLDHIDEFRYIFESVIGEGCLGVVRKVCEIEASKSYAAKSLAKERECHRRPAPASCDF